MMRRVALGVALVLIAGAVVWIEAPWRPGSEVPPAPEDVPEAALEHPGAPDFAGATGWVNSEPLDLVALRGQVVLVDFWTYSCINCINTFPYIRAWDDRYRDHGLVIVGVHTPEFRFEREAENVQDATDRYGLEHAIALDNRYEIWDAYNNRFWPAKYLIDEWGRIRYTHFGEGAYIETEERIRALLEEAGYDPGPGLAVVEDRGGGRARGQTPELFASHLDGYKRHGIGNEEGYHPGETITYAEPAEVRPDKIFLVGTWANHDDRVVAVSDDARVLLGFTAGVASPVLEGPEGACVTVRLDGGPIPEALAGNDVSFDGPVPCAFLDDPRSYDLYVGPFEEHLLELGVPAETALFSFAFSAEGPR